MYIRFPVIEPNNSFASLHHIPRVYDSACSQSLLWTVAMVLWCWQNKHCSISIEMVVIFFSSGQGAALQLSTCNAFGHFSLQQIYAVNKRQPSFNYDMQINLYSLSQLELTDIGSPILPAYNRHHYLHKWLETGWWIWSKKCNYTVTTTKINLFLWGNYTIQAKISLPHITS